jgi:hypothetical protein
MVYNAIKDDSYQTPKSFSKTYPSDDRGALSDTKNDLQDTAAQVGNKVNNFVGSASDEISHAASTATNRIRGNPVQSSLIALGTGFILGTLLRR